MAGPIVLSLNLQGTLNILYAVIAMAIIAYVARMPNKKNYYLPFMVYAIVAAAFALILVYENAASTALQAASRQWPTNSLIGPTLMFPLAYNFILNFTTTKMSVFQKCTLAAGYAYWFIFGAAYVIDPSYFGYTVGHFTDTGYTPGPQPYSTAWWTVFQKTPPIPFLAGHQFFYDYLALTILPLYYLFRYYRSTESPLVKSQIRYLSVGVFFDWFGIVWLGFAIFGPLRSFPNLQPIFQTITVIVLFAGLTKHGFKRVTPTLETAAPLPQTYTLEDGRSYLARDSESSFDAFAELVRNGREGLCVTRKFPDDVRRTYGLESTPIRWLAEERRDDAISATDLLGLSLTVKDFMNKAKKPVVMIQGLEYLTRVNGFDPVIRLLDGLHEAAGPKNGILLIPVTPNTLEPKEDALLVAETVPQPAPSRK